MRTQLRRPERDREFELAANHAYYGGRFEVSRHGLIPRPVYQNDVHSAYPAQMPELPCPLHTRWKHRPRARHLPKDELYLAKITFAHPPDTLWCGLPFRRKGTLFWPLQGTGWYWSPEIAPAQRWLGTDVIKVHDLWVARRECNCRLFDWVRDLYDERRRVGSATLGYPLKLGLNSLYGKMAQRSGRGPYHDPVAAGLITAMTRAQLIEAVGQDPEAVVMLATDAVFSTRQLPLDFGEGLGQWEPKVWPDLFIAQPGVYWSPTDLETSVKSRGVRRSVIGDAAPKFQQVFSDWIEVLRRPAAMELMLKERQLIPSVPVTVHVFYGCRLALARSKPWLAGTWKDETRYESFEWSTKRDPMRVRLDYDGCSSPSRYRYHPSRRAKAINRPISTGLSKSPVRAAVPKQTTKTCCLRRCPISCPFCRMNEPLAAAAPLATPPRASAAICVWCGRSFTPRRTGGSVQRFCTSGHRQAFWAAARRWTMRAIETGLLSVDCLKAAQASVHAGSEVLRAGTRRKPVEPS